jgi:hypothetical protein
MPRFRSPILLLLLVLLAKTFAGHFAALWFGYAFWVLPVVIAAGALILTIVLFASDSDVEPMPEARSGRIDTRRPIQNSPAVGTMAYTPEWVHYLTLACIAVALLSLLSLITIPVLRLALSCLPLGL